MFWACVCDFESPSWLHCIDAHTLGFLPDFSQESELEWQNVGPESWRFCQNCDWQANISGVAFYYLATQQKQKKLEQLERLRSEDTPRRLRITHTIESCWIPQVKTRSNDLEDIGQGQRSWHATHLLMLVIICTTYGKNPPRTVDVTEGIRFTRSRPNDFENIGQGQKWLHAAHPLMLMMICAKYGKNPSRTVVFFSRSRLKNLPKIQISRFCKKRNTRHTL